MPEAECIVLFHILVDGECDVLCERHPTVTLESGDVVVFLRGDQHTMRSKVAAVVTPLSSIFSPGGTTSRRCFRTAVVERSRASSAAI